VPISCSKVDKKLAALGLTAALLIGKHVVAQDLPPDAGAAPAPPAQQGGGGVEASAERVIVTGSNIPTAEEAGPNPVDTYRPEDLEKLGARNATDLLIKLPQQVGSTINQNANGASGGDGAVIPNLRGLLPKETLVLIDGKRAAIIGSGGGLGAGASPGVAGVDINLIPFPMIDHIDILKDGASAIYGSDAVAGVFNIFLKHKFRDVEIGSSIGNTNLGSSNDGRELETWMIAGTGNDKTDIVIIADAYDKAAIYGSDRNITSNANQLAWGGFDNRSVDFPGVIGPFNDETPLGFRLIPKLFFSGNSPPPHSATNVSTSPYYTNNVPYPDGKFAAYNFAAVAATVPAADRQSIYGSFTRDTYDKYLTVFADFKYTRSFFGNAGAATGFFPDPFKNASGNPFSPDGISVPIANPFNPFTEASVDDKGNPITLPDGTPVTTGVHFSGIRDTGGATSKTTFYDILFDAGLRGQMGEFGDYFKNWNWESGFRYSRNEEDTVRNGVVSARGLREALLDTDPATAFNPFLGYRGRNTAATIRRVYVTLHGTGEFELRLAYLHLGGDLFNLPAGPVSFAAGLEYRGERWRNDPDPLNTSFDAIGTFNSQAAKVNRDVWSIYQEVRIPVTSPAWNFPGAYSLEFDIAEREEWYSQNTSASTAPFVLPEEHSQYDAQKPKFSVRWQPLEPRWIGALTLRGSYSEGFNAPTLPDLTPAGTELFAIAGSDIHDPTGLTPDGTAIQFLVAGNPLLKPEVAYEWSYGVVYSPKWIRGLTLSADFWHIDLRSIAALPDGQFILDHEKLFLQYVIRDPPTTGPLTTVIDPNLNLPGAVVEGLDYEAIYILDSAIFGGGDFGRFTFTLNGTYLSRFELQVSPDTHRLGLSGSVVFLPTLTGSLPHTRAFASAFWDGPTNTWLAGFDIGATVHYTGQYEDDNIALVGAPKPQQPRIGPDGFTGKLARKVREWTTLDLIASYTFNIRRSVAQQQVAGYGKDGGKNIKMPDGTVKNVVPVSTAEYGARGWRAWLNGATITLGMQNVFDSDPPFAAVTFANGYDASLADVKGRFWYLQLTKRF
jgi:iron complex outermembrane recepter protein